MLFKLQQFTLKYMKGKNTGGNDEYIEFDSKLSGFIGTKVQFDYIKEI